jgi:hypothetical protein
MDAAIIVTRVLKESRLISSLMGMATDEIFPGIVKEIEVLEQYPGSNELSESGRALANNASRLMFEDLAARHPKRAETMASAIETLGTTMPDSIIIDNYDWASLGTAIMVDVGGSKGIVCRQLTEHFPKLSFIVLDLEETAAAGRDTLSPEFNERITYMTHDFFTPQLVKDADVYFFRAGSTSIASKYCEI